MQKLYTRRNLIASFLFIAGVVILAGFFTYRNISQAINQTSHVNASLQSLRALEDLMDDMQDMETGQRGFLVSGNPVYLEPYQAGLDRLATDTVAILNLIPLYPERVNIYRNLLGFVVQKKSLSDQSVSLFGQGKKDSALISIQTGSESRVMDSIRQIINSLETEDRLILKQSNTKRQDAAQTTTRILIALVIIFFFGLGLLLWRLLKEESSGKKYEQQNAYLARLTEQTSDAIFSTDIEGILLSWNAGAEKMYGYAKEEVIGRFAPEITGSGNTREYVAGFETRIPHKGNTTLEIVNYDKQGKRMDCFVSVTGLYNDKEELTGYVAVLRDISDRKKNQELLEKFNEELSLQVEQKTIQLKSIVERIRDGFFSLDNNWRFTFVNEYMCRLTKRSAADLLGKSIWEEYPEAVNAPEHQVLQMAMQTQEQKEHELFFPPLGKWFQAQIYPSPTGLSVFFRDITAIRKAEERLRRSNERFDLISRTTNDAIWEWNLETGEMWGNEVHQRLYGLGMSDPVPEEKEWQSRLHPDDREELVKKQEAALATDTNIFITEYRFKTDTAGYRNIYDRCYIVRNKEGKAIRLLGNMMDITERKKAADALEQSEKKYRAYFDNSMDGILLTSMEGKIFAANPAACAIFDMTEKEFREAGLTSLTDASDPRLGRLMEERRQTGKAMGEITMICKNGERFPAEISSAVFTDAAGNMRTSMIVRDITERKKAEQQLQARENHLSTILNSEPECIKLLGPKGELLEMNPAGLAMIEADDFDIVKNKSVLGIILPEYREAFSQLTANVFQGSSGILVFEIEGLKGTRRWLETHAVPLRDGKGTIISLLGITRDITQKRAAEQAIISSEETHRLIMNSALDAIVCIDKNEQITVWTPQAERIFGWKEEEAIGRKISETIIPEKYKDRHSQGMKRYLETGVSTILNKPHEFTAINKAGSAFPIELSIIHVEQGEKEFFCAFMRDITVRKKAEADLQESEEKLRQILSSSADDFYVIDRNYRVSMINKTAQKNLEQAFGRKLETGMYIPDIFPEDRKASIKMNYDLVFTGERVDYEINIVVEGNTLWKRVQYGPVRDERGYINGVFVATSDITGRKNAEEEIKKTNARFQIVSRATSDIVWDLDILTGRIWRNDNYYQILGYRKVEEQELLEDWFSYIHPDELKGVKKKLQETLAGPDSVWRDEYRYLRPDGSYLHFLDRGYVLRDTDGKAYRMIGSMVDMTPIYQVQKKVIESEYRMRTILDTNPECIKLLDKDCRLLDINKAGLIMIEADSLEQVAGSDILQVVADEQKEQVATLIKKTFSGRSGSLEFAMIALKGTRRWCEMNIVPFRGAGDEIISALAVTRDITEKKFAELELARNEEKYRTLVEQASDGIFIISPEGRFLTVNQSCSRITGYSEEELKEVTFYAMALPEDLAATPPKFGELKQGKPVITERPIKRKDGRIIDIEIAAKQLMDGNILVFARDITERKKAEEELRQSEEKYRTLVEQAVDAIALYDASGKILEVNTGSVNLLGYSLEELLGMSLKDVLTGEEIRTNPVQYDVLQEGKSTIKQRKMRRKDGTVLDTEVRSQQLPDGRFLSVIRDHSERIKAEQELQESYRALRELTGHLQNIREEERSNIAREIHDELGQQLTVLKMDISWLSKKLENPGENVKERLNSLLEMIDNTVRSVRRISSELRPSMLDDLGLPAAIEWHALEFGKRSGIRTHTQVATGDVKLPGKVGITLFRVFQECLTNVARHSGADRVDVRLCLKDKRLHLEIQDNGQGFLVKEIESKKTLGILGMKERVSLIRGEFAIESKPGKGTTVRVSVAFEEIK